MKNISLTFQVHQPVRLKRYRFFDIGNDNYYFDDFNNERIVRKSAEECYLPTNEILLDLLTEYKGQFKVAFSISGTAIDLFSLYAPEVIESFQRLSATGGVEFLGETYAHSLASEKDRVEFKRQIKAHVIKMKELFGQRPCVFKNTELIYSDEVGKMVAEMGFKAVLAEGARNILRWRSPNYLYRNPMNPELKLLFKNTRLSEDIAFRLSNPDWTGWPKTANNYLSALNSFPTDEKIVNLFMDYEMVGKGQKQGTGIFNFLRSFPLAVFEMTEYGFMTPFELISHYHPAQTIEVPNTISRADEGGDLTDWQGNELQQEALGKLYGLKDSIARCTNADLLKDWQYLQSSDHFYYMYSKFFSNRDFHHDLNPYDNPYEAFMNYMNVLSDFTLRLNKLVRKKGYPPVMMRSKKKITIEQ